MEDVKIHATIKGEGDGMVLLHGWGCDHHMMSFIQEHFSIQYQVLAIDLPGFGESEEPPVAWNLRHYAQCIHMLIQRYQMKNVILVAHSFGARIAFSYALMYPVKAMVLTGAAGIKEPLSLHQKFKILFYKGLKRLHVPCVMGSADYQNASEIMKKILVMAIHEDFTSRLSTILVPTLLIWGERDQQTPLWMARKMNEQLPMSYLLVLQGDDHFAFYHQQQRFLAILDAYLGAMT